MMTLRWTALASCLAAPLQADTLMDGPAFDAYVTGRTLTFGLPDGQSFGVEQYLPDQRVIWSPLDGTCTDGEWFEDGPLICFLYENDPEAKCWFVYRTDTGIRAEFANTPGSTILFEAQDAPEPLICGDLFS